MARRGGIALMAVAALAGAAQAQLRVVAWNLSNYSGSDRQSAIQTAVYGSFEGRRMAPDIMLMQEFSSAAALSTFLNVVNTAPGSPGDWAAAPYLSSPDSTSVMIYRTSKVTLLGVTRIAQADAGTTGQPRDTFRFDIRPVGYSAASTCLGMYNVHLKAGSTSTDNTRRLVETERIRLNAQGQDTNPSEFPNDGLPAGWNFMVAGDFNMQSSSQTSYQQLVASQANNTGRCFDPINTPGSWNNSNTFRMIHTQDPVGAGGMDDRHDQILVSGNLLDADGLDYIGLLAGLQNPVAWNLSRWDDPNHSYRCYGNDGTSYDLQLTVAGNVAVGPTIAQALRDCATTSGGHLPVLVDLRVPAKVTATTIVDFGQVVQNAAAQLTFSVGNNGNVTLWTSNGIQPLRYSMSASSGFSVPTGQFIDAPGGNLNNHTVTMSTSTPGLRNGTIQILSNDPDQPTRFITLVGEVVAPSTCPPCAADYNDSGGTPDDADVAEFFAAWNAGDDCADVNQSGGTPDDGDVTLFFELWNAGGC